MSRLNFVTDTVKVEEAQLLTDGQLTVCKLSSFAGVF